MDSYRQRQITYIHTAQTVLSAIHTRIHLLKLPLQGFSAIPLQPDCKISSNYGKNKVSRVRATCLTRRLC